MLRLYVVLFFIFLFGDTMAQDFSGRILSDDRKPLAEVYLFNTRSNTHTHSTDMGYFQLRNTKSGDTIQVIHLGYQPKQVIVSAPKTDIILTASPLQLNEVVVSTGLNHLSAVTAIDLKTSPVNSAQELLRKVPGLFIGQHAGGGKAEQLFLRGFDLDHGTDINISVDGIPVNMLSHGHGQGYADLHFLIPETVESIDFDKGPYHTDKGNLATAGYVAFNTKDHLAENSLSVEGGSFNTFKGLAMFNLLNRENESAYIAGSYLLSDGPFEASQDFKRLNFFGKYTKSFKSQDRLSLSVAHFNSTWNASGQIPQRAVDAGMIGRFGAIDPDEGGVTDRTNIRAKFDKYINPAIFLSNTFFYSNYNFELYSNFTFFLEDPVNGDQIRQKDSRNMLGFESVLHRHTHLGNFGLNLQTGLGLRYDDVNGLELSHTLDRSITLNRIRYGDVNETNGYGFLNAEFELGKLLINPGLRFDTFRFSYRDLLNNGAESAKSQSIISPKLNFLYSQNANLQFFLKLGKGFHSNDTRVVVTEQVERTLPAAYGADIGMSWKPTSRLILNAGLWYLYLQQEFVYVGDAGETEPSGRTIRKGIDFGLRYQLNNWLFFNGDVSFNRGRYPDERKDENYIALAPPVTFTGGLSVNQLHHFSGGIRSRYLASRPANEDNSIIAKGYFITDANVNYTLKRFTFGLIAENIFNSAWNETQFATESRLKNELSPVKEIHFTPGAPFSVRALVGIKF